MLLINGSPIFLLKQARLLGREIRLHMCQKSAASQGARDFVEKHYVPLKQNNPK
jgi:hypothetical protein